MKFNFAGFEYADRSLQSYDDSIIESTGDVDSIVKEIFAPNPVTGLPSSDLHIALTRSADPVVSDYISRVLLSPNPNSSPRCEDPDVVLGLMRGIDESESEYLDRLIDAVEQETARKE